MSTTEQDRQVVSEAISEAQSEYGERLRDFALVLQPDHLRLEYGAWLLPAYCASSESTRKSYELHRLIESIEEFTSERSGRLVTVFLQPATSRNGAT